MKQQLKEAQQLQKKAENELQKEIRNRHNHLKGDLRPLGSKLDDALTKAEELKNDLRTSNNKRNQYENGYRRLGDERTILIEEAAAMRAAISILTEDAARVSRQATMAARREAGEKRAASAQAGGRLGAATKKRTRPL